MALKKIRIGSAADIFQYDDGIHDSAISTDGEPIEIGPSVLDSHAIRQDQLPTLGSELTSDDVITDNAVVRGDGGARKIQDSLVLIDDAGKENIPGGTHIGGVANYLDITADGVLTLHGTAERILNLRPEIDFSTQVAHAKPTQVTIGIFKGFSFPIYAADDEELFFRQDVPGRWDGKSNITFHAYICLAADEDVGDYFKFRLSWEHAPFDSVLPITSHDVDVEQIVLVGRNAQYDLYELIFVIDYDIDGVGNEIQVHELIAAKLYRIDATAPNITGEVILLDGHTIYNVDKMFKAS